ncbi:MAG: short-chain dehydrogenase [Gammaproteobacteria bacterium]|nr:short-chain dehydrogenase [Gammaproteobacteria bacterium]
MHINLKGKLALVCASTKGLGFSSALNLAKAGCNVILTGRSNQNLSKARLEILNDCKKIGIDISVECIKVDLNEVDSLPDFESKLDSLPDIDILVVNSGGPSPGTFESFSNAEIFESESSKITYPAITLIKYVLPSMKKNNWGRIINISSIGLAKPITGLAVSNASRSFLAGLMVGIANENAKFGITVNTIMPGIIWTERQKMLAEHDSELQGIPVDQIVADKAAMVPSGKIGEPDDVGSLTTFLSSKNASYINGQFIAVDGGFLGLLR